MDEEVNVETVPVVDDIVPVVDETNSVQGRNSPRYTPRAEEVDPDSVPPHKLPAMDARSFVPWSPDELSSVYTAFGTGRKAADYLSKTTLEIINNSPEFYGMADPLAVKDGSAEILRYIGLPVSERGKGFQNSEQVLRYFTNLKEFGDAGVPTRGEALASGALEGGGALFGGLKGARYGALAGAPFGPWGVAGGAFTGFVVGSVAGGITGDVIGDLTMDQIDAKRPLMPTTEEAIKTYQATGTAIPFILNPALGPVSRITQAHLVRKLPERSFAGTLTPDDLANPFIKKYLEKKSYKPLKALAWAEDLLISGGQAYQKASTAGRAAILATEATAVPATFGLVSAAQNVYGPRSDAAVISGELLGGIAPNVTFLKHLPNLKDALVKFYKEKKQTKAETGSLDLLGRRQRVEKDEIQKILSFIEEKGEDPEAILGFLEETFLLPNGKLKPEFIEIDPKTKKPKTTQTFSSQFVESPALASLDAQVMRNMGDLEDVRESSFGKSMSMQRALIEELRGTGDSNLIKVASQIQQSRIELLMQKRTDQAINTAALAVKQLYPEGGPKAADMLGKNISDIMNKQREIFRNIEEDTWKRVDGTATQTVFQRTDPETGDVLPGEGSDIPNVVEAWDRIVAEKGQSTAEFLTLLDDNDFKVVSRTIDKFKQQLGIATDVNPLAEVPKPVTAFTEAYENASGETWRDTFDTLLKSNNFVRENGKISPTQENIDKLATLIEDQRENKLLKTFETKQRALSGKNDVFGNPYQNEALRIEREALAGTTVETPGPNEIELERVNTELSQIRSGYESAKSNDSYQRHRTINLDEKINNKLDQIRAASDEIEIDELADGFVNEFSEGYGYESVDKALELVLAEAQLAKLQALPFSGERETVTGTAQSAIEALNSASVGLRSLGANGKLRADALDARRMYLADKLERETSEITGRVEPRPPGPLAALLDSMKKGLIARRRAANITPDAETEIDPLSANELIGLRKTLRTMNTKYNGPNGSNDFARLTTELRQAALEDLMSYGETGAAYQEAVDVSFAFNEYFKRTFGQDVLQKDARGRIIVNPDAGMNTLFSGNPDAMQARMTQINRMGERIVETAIKFGADESQLSKITNNLGTQDEVLHDAFTTLLQKETSAVEEKFALSGLEVRKRQLQRIRDWSKRYEDVVSFFPSIQRQLDAINEPQEFIEAVEKSVARTKVYLKETAAFKSAVSGRNGIASETPTAIIESIYTSPNPSRQLRALALNLDTMPTEETARKVFAEMGKTFPEEGVFTPKEATEGLQRAVMDYAFQSAGVNDLKGGLGNFDAGVLYKKLFEKMPNANNESQTLANFLEARGAINEMQRKTMKSALERIVAMQAQSAATGADMSGIDVPAIMDLYTRIAGARIGQLAGSILPGGRSAGLIEESAGSKYARQITQEIPFLQEQDAFQRILLDPEKLMLAMRTPRSANEKAGIMTTLINFLKAPISAVAKGGLNVPIREVAIRGPAAVIEEITSEEAPPQPDPLDTPKPTSVGRRRGPQRGPRAVQPTEDMLKKAREFIDLQKESSLQPMQRRDLPPATQQTAALSPAPTGGAGGIASLASGPVDRAKAQQLFPNDITFAARGGAIHSGIGAFR